MFTACVFLQIKGKELVENRSKSPGNLLGALSFLATADLPGKSLWEALGLMVLDL